MRNDECQHSSSGPFLIKSFPAKAMSKLPRLSRLENIPPCDVFVSSMHRCYPTIPGVVLHRALSILISSADFLRCRMTSHERFLGVDTLSTGTISGSLPIMVKYGKELFHSFNRKLSMKRNYLRPIVAFSSHSPPSIIFRFVSEDFKKNAYFDMIGNYMTLFFSLKTLQKKNL